MKYLILVLPLAALLSIPCPVLAQTTFQTTAFLYNPTALPQTAIPQTSIMFMRHGNDAYTMKQSAFYLKEPQKRSHLGGALLGVAGGLLLGFIVGDLATPECGSQTYCFRDLNVIAATGLGGLVGGITGGIIGLPTPTQF
jgi:hypothetical protein